MLESIDLGTLIEGGGSGTLIGLALWRLGTIAKSFVADFHEAREQWRADQVAMRKHYSTEEELLSELRDDRRQEKAVREAEQNLQRELMRALKDERKRHEGPSIVGGQA
ncbi:MAG: hypothetical protein MJE66_15380 [Proteobacteria bacterium]|nr:hypothetical protein [Pseudomonadota bacterium]